MTTNLKNIAQFPDLIQNKIDYWSYLTPEFENHLNHYLPVFEKSRADKKIMPSAKAWKLLPFGPFANDDSWQWKRQSLNIAQKCIGNKKQDAILEIGAWNGWLTKYLAKQSELVLAVDYFVCPYDGIGNIQSFAKNIVALQSNLETIGSDFKIKSFDVIVLNHCLSFFKNPTAYIESLLPLLKDGGILISLGSTFYKNTKKKAAEIKSFAHSFYEKYQTEVFIQPVKGYMDIADLNELKNIGFEIDEYPKMKLQNTYAKLISSKPVYVSILYKK